MEDVKSIIADVRKQYTNISIRHKNQCPCHLQKMAALELVYRKPVQVPSDQGQLHKLDGDRVDIVSEQEDHLTYSDLFMKQPEPKRHKLGRDIIFIEGEAGMGKSILCTLIVDDWASGRQFQEYSIVLLLPLYQHSVVSVCSLLELVTELYELNEECCSSLADFLEKSTSNILIIADGWDQLVKLYQPKKLKQTFLYKLLFGDHFSNSSVTIIVTSRPMVDVNVLSTLQCVNLFVTVKGFSQSTIQTCVESEFSSEAGRSTLLTEQIENNPLVKNICRVPLNLALICGWYQTCSELFPYTVNELYRRLIWSPLRISNSACVGVKSHLDLSEDLQESWWLLCKLAFKNIKKIDATKYMSAKISLFGLLKSVSKRQSEVFFQFLHPTIQEYLAAQHLTQASLTIAQLEQCAKMPYLGTIFWRFLLCAYVASDLQFVETNIVHHVLSKLSYSSNDLCHCSFEAKNEIINREVIKALSSTDNSSGSVLMKLGPSENVHDFMAIMYVIENVKQQCFVEINFRNSDLTPEQVYKFGSILGSKSDRLQIKALDISCNGFNNKNIAEFCHKAVSALLSVEKLFLRNCGIKTIVDAMMDALNKNLMQLDLSLNPLSISCLQALQCRIETGIFMKLEILLLKASFPSNVCMSFLVGFTESLASKCPCFRHLDLSDNYLGKPGNPNLRKMISRLIHLRRDFNLHLNDEYMAEVDSNFVSAFQESILKRGKIDYTVAHGIIVGPGRSGKDSLMKRLLGEKLVSKSFSTGVLESVVKVEVQKMSTVAAAVGNLKWQRLEYDEEALELMMTTARYYSSSSSSKLSKPLRTRYVVEKYSPDVAVTNSSCSSGSDVDAKPSNCTDSTEVEYFSSIPGKSASIETTSRNVVVYSSNVAPVDILKKALRHRHSMNALREHLESSWSLYLTNTGGQIEFQELLPLLVCGPSVFFITFPLNHDLDKPYTVKYERPSGEFEPYRSATTLIEELLQTLATVSAIDYTCSQCNSDKVPKIFFIGTHKDELRPEAAVEQIIKKIDEQLQKCIKNTVLFEKDLIQFNNPKEKLMIFTVNNLSTCDDDFQTIRSAVQNTVEKKRHRNQFKVTCPSSWLIFSLILRAKHKSNERFLSFDKCFDIAQECGISDHVELTQALSFIHSRLGLVRYFNVEELDGFVVIDPQILFDTITKLVYHALEGSCTEESEIENFQRGIVPAAMVERISEQCTSSMQLPFTWLMKLLNYLRISALFTDHDRVNKYFFPSAICRAPLLDQTSPLKSSFAPELLVGFKNGFCPRGISGALIKYLMTNEMKAKRPWKLHRNMIFRNQVSFEIKPYGSITLKIFSTHLEIFLNAEDHQTDEDASMTCKEAYTQIEAGMNAITRDYINCKFFFGFYCTFGHECEVYPHPAKIDRKEILTCTIKHYKVRDLPKGYNLWNIRKRKSQGSF